MRALSPIRRLVVLLAGIFVLAIGIALVFLPGPAILVIPAGLAILASEFDWARKLLRKARLLFRRYRKQARHSHGS